MSLLQRLPFELLLGRVFADRAAQETMIRRSAEGQLRHAVGRRLDQRRAPVRQHRHRDRRRRRFLPVWAKTRGNFDVRGVAAITAMPIALVTTNPAVKSLKDFTDKDRIALPSVKSSIQAATLQIAAEKEFGAGKHEQLDVLTVSMKHPDAYAALASGRSEVTAHFGSPPFQQQELLLPNARKITDSYEALGGAVTFNVAWAKAAFREKNPKVYGAFIAALKEADAFIEANPEDAARIHLAEEKGTAGEALILSIVKDPASRFTITPLNTIKYADFLFRTGGIKAKAESWKDLYFPELQAEPGS
jgi:NitT/TauT family transport system substrate-binding protein